MIREMGRGLKMSKGWGEVVGWWKKNVEMGKGEYEKKGRMNLWVGKRGRRVIVYEIEGKGIMVGLGCVRGIVGVLEGEVVK